MSNETPGMRLTDFDLLTCLISVGSLLGSAYSARLLIPAALNRSIYGGTAVMVLIVIVSQVLGFAVVVGIPALVLLVRRRFRLSRLSIWLLALGIAGVVAEAIALGVIPSGGNC